MNSLYTWQRSAGRGGRAQFFTQLCPPTPVFKNRPSTSPLLPTTNLKQVLDKHLLCVKHCVLLATFIYSSEQRFPTGVPREAHSCAARFPETCNTWLFNQGHGPLLPQIIKLKHDYRQHSNSRPVRWIKMIPIFCQTGKKM